MSTPCNSLNVQLIKVSQLASYSSLKDADQLMIVENTGGSKFSRNSQLSDVRDYMLGSGLSGFPNDSFKSYTDTNNLNAYTSGAVFTYSHGFGVVPALVKVVLLCNSNDGYFLTNDELDIFSCYNNNNRPLVSVSTGAASVKISFASFTSVYTYSPSPVTSILSLNKLNWQIKTYIWK